MEHRVIPAGQVGVPHNWRVANASERNALTINDASEIGKLLLQDDNGRPSYWVLIGVSPAKWAPVSGAPGDAFSIDAIGTLADRDQYDDEPTGFTFFDEEDRNLYIKISDASGDWTDPIPFGKGDPGEGVPTGGEPGQALFKNSTADYDTVWRQPTKTDVGLSNVDNTADVDKPISDATADALDDKVDKDGDKVLSDNNYTDADKQAVTDLPDNLAAIEQSVTDLETSTTTALDGKVDKVAGYGLSQNDLTDDRANKLDSLSKLFLGVFPSLAALEAAHPTAEPGQFAQVDAGVGTDVINYNWDDNDGQWVEGGSGGSAATNTDQLPEGSANLYFTTARVLATALAGLSLLTGGAITSTDTVVIAFGKLQKQITDILTTIGLLDARVDDVETEVGTLGTTVSDLQTDVAAITTLPYFKHPYETSETLIIGDGERAVSAGISVVGEGSITVTGDGRLAIV